MIIQVGQAIGALWTILLLIADSMIGARLLRWQGRRAWRSFQEALAAGTHAAPRDPRRRADHPRRRVPADAGLHHGHRRLLLLIPPTRAVVRRAASPRCSLRPARRARGRARWSCARRDRGRPRADRAAARRRPADRRAAELPPRMIGPGDEQAQSGAGRLSRRRSRSSSATRARPVRPVRIARVPAAGRRADGGRARRGGELVAQRSTRAGAAPSQDWERARVGGARARRSSSRSSAGASALDAPDGGFDLELERASAPIDLDEPPRPSCRARGGRAAATSSSATCAGRVDVGGRRRPIDGVGAARAHAGARPTRRRRGCALAVRRSPTSAARRRSPRVRPAGAAATARS